MGRKLGIVAGQGDLPFELYDAALRQGRDTFVLALEGQADPEKLDGIPHEWVSVNAIGRVIETAHRNAVEDLVLTGDFQPWHLVNDNPDEWVRARLPQIVERMRGGENEAVAFLIEEVEKDGFRIVAARSLAANMFPQTGALGRHEPNTEAWMDIARGVEAAKTIGRLDIGQAVVVQRRVVLAVEAVEGTDALITRSKALQKEGPGPVLVKMMKPQQEIRADPPTIGPRTLDLAAGAGFIGIAIEADGTLVADRAATVRIADDAGLFLVAVRPPE
jgi:DUF1009 family protein